MNTQLPSSDTSAFQSPIVTDEDIIWVSNLLRLPKNAFCGADGHDPREVVLKSIQRLDVAACPGSGKTTLLVAKLAILARKWRHRTRGICVLSHTNAARIEIETKLGNTSVGRQLLSYPHYVGTIHGFVDDFLALPWLRSLGYSVRMIDTEVCLKRRWARLSANIRSGLEKNHHTQSVLSVKTTDFQVGRLRWGKHYLGKDTATANEIRAVCRQTATEGYFCFEEIFLWAADLINNAPGITGVIRDRFPLLFIDEAQDNSESQSAILFRIFMDGSNPVLRQRFGDANQAIFDLVEAEGAKTDPFPGPFKRDLPNSHRFGQRIADLVAPLGLNHCALTGHGPKSQLDSGAAHCRHTIFLFDNASVSRVLDAFGDLLLDSFSDRELLDGTFWAIGQVHRRPVEEKSKKFPHHIGHYWPTYDPELTKADAHPQTFVQYIFAGQEKAKVAKEAYPAVEKIAEGLLRLAGMVEGSPTFRERRHNHRYILELLEATPPVRRCYQDLITDFALMRVALTKEMWDGTWQPLVREITEHIAGAPLSWEATAFLEWKDWASKPKTDTLSKCHDNIYRYSRDSRHVDICFGSIHSVKGRTHTATLVLETFWRGSKNRHNLELLLPWLRSIKIGGNNEGEQQQSRLKVHYVAFTRPTHLLCLAMKKSSFRDHDEKNLDKSVVSELEKCGWQVKVI